MPDWVGSLMGLSLESMRIDNDMLGASCERYAESRSMKKRFHWRKSTMPFIYDGHFLRQDQTLKLMRTEYEYPELADRSTPGDWQDEGSPDIRQRAGQRVRSILSSHYPQYIDPGVDKLIRERYPIRLPGEFMQAGSDRW